MVSTISRMAEVREEGQLQANLVFILQG